MIAMTRIALFSAMIVHFTSAIAIAQTVKTRAREDSYLLAYFLDEEPSDVGLAALPTNARDVVVAKVSLTRGPIYLVKRESSGVSGPPAKYLFRSWLRLVQVIRGVASVGEQFDVTFRKPNFSGKMTMVPHTHDEVSREYFVIAYVDEDDHQRHLAGYPISEAKYQAWKAAVMERITKFPR